MSKPKSSQKVPSFTPGGLKKIAKNFWAILGQNIIDTYFVNNQFMVALSYHAHTLSTIEILYEFYYIL